MIILDDVLTNDEYKLLIKALELNEEEIDKYTFTELCDEVIYSNNLVPVVNSGLPSIVCIALPQRITVNKVNTIVGRNKPLTFEEAFKKVCEDEEWEVEDYVDTWYISKYTSCGEDFGFDVNKNQVISDLESYADNFDAEQHAYELFGNNRGEPSLQDLLDDAECIQNDLDSLVGAALRINEDFIIIEKNK